MAAKGISYAQLLETNNLMQSLSDETYWLSVTRTVAESKLFPVSAYFLLANVMAFYRWPALLRKIETRMSAEDIGDRCRGAAIKVQNPTISAALATLYLMGREWLINMGLLRPQDAAEDIIYLMDFRKRFQLSYHRNDGHVTNQEFGHRAQILPERQLQVFHADMYDCAEGEPLHQAAHGFLAAASQYGFLVSCESRVSLQNTGPYRLADDREMIVRDFRDLSENALPWQDGVAGGVPYNNLTVVMAVKDCHFHLIDDWGSFESKPEFRSEHLVGAGLYTSDILSDGYIPVGMGSKGELTETFTSLTARIKDANTRLWRRIAGWSRDQMIDAGAIHYFAMIKDLAHVAGIYEVDDWMNVDERAERFRPLLNDEFSRDTVGELMALLTHPSQRINDYAMMQHSDKPQRMFSPIPYSILCGEDYVASCGPLRPGVTHHAPKIDRYTTTRGVLTLAEYNRLARETTPAVCTDKYRFLCDTWVKYHYDTPLADELYGLAQADSRLLEGAGAGLRRADVEALRGSAR
jgi:hypothetical protein